MKYHFILLEWLKLKKQTKISVDKDVEKLEPLDMAGENVKCNSHFENSSSSKV